MILLQLFKVAHHVTGNDRWAKEYRKLALEEPYRYADLACEHYERYENKIKEYLRNEELDSDTLFPIVVKTMNYSDTRMAAVVRSSRMTRYCLKSSGAARTAGGDSKGTGAT